MGARGEPTPATYASAGVDIDAGEAAVDRIKKLVASTSRPEVLGELGGFGGAFGLDTSKYERPVLVASTDGVGTKALVAQQMGRFDTIGIDLVAMCVDDVVCVGAEPLFLLDYVSTGKLDPEQMGFLVSGVAEGCRQAGCALLGGEMAEHPGVGDSEPGAFDLVGFVVGVVDRDRMLGPERVEPGDVLVGLLSPGLRSNGYSLARHVLFERAGKDLEDPAYEGSGRSLGEELLLPSVIYAPAVLEAVAGGVRASGVGGGGVGGGGVHAAAHVTGGGIVQNLARVLPPDYGAVVRRSAFETPRIFDEIQRLGNIEDAEMARVFNLGIGMLLVVAEDSADDAISAVEKTGCRAAVVGQITKGARRVDLVP